MLIDTKERHGTVREGYQLLLRADAKLLLPTEHTRICEFYERMCQACMTWAIEMHGERLRGEFLQLESVREKSRVRTQGYRFSMRIPWTSDRHAVFLCESVLNGHSRDTHNTYRRISHMWNLEEETVLPISQIMDFFDIKLKRDMLPFKPDGVYPDGGGLVLFRNPTRTSPFMERKLEVGVLKARKKEE